MEKKISKWLSEGLIDSDTAEKLLLRVREDKLKLHKIKINITIYTIAVILIGLGVITFISANDWLLELLNSNRFLKIFLMLAVTYLSFWGGFKLAYEKQNLPRLGNGLIILSTFLIGATYALIGQVYNFSANSSMLIFLWLISIAPIAYAIKSKTINFMSIILLILGIVYAYYELAIDDGLIWSIYIPVLCGVLLYNLGNIPYVLNKFPDFSLAYKLVGIIPVYVILMVLTCSVEHSYHITSPYYIVPMVLLLLFNFINYAISKNRSLLLKIETTAVAVILLSLLLLLILPSVSTSFVTIMANLWLVAIISFGFNYGYKFENARIISLTNTLLIIYLFVNYCRWGWSYLDKSLFFTLGGISLLILGIMLEKRKKELVNKGEIK